MCAADDQNTPIPRYITIGDGDCAKRRDGGCTGVAQKAHFGGYKFVHDDQISIVETNRTMFTTVSPVTRNYSGRSDVQCCHQMETTTTQWAVKHKLNRSHQSNPSLYGYAFG